jgi:hypothetical protein
MPALKYRGLPSTGWHAGELQAQEALGWAGCLLLGAERHVGRERALRLLRLSGSVRHDSRLSLISVRGRVSRRVSTVQVSGQGSGQGNRQSVCTISKSLQRACRGEFLVRKRPSHFSLRAPSEVWSLARKLAVLQPTSIFRSLWRNWPRTSIIASKPNSYLPPRLLYAQ